jgi:acetolactate synthase-1/2/3 large subunit
VLKRTGRAIGTYLNQEVDYGQIMDAMGGYGERVTDPNEIKPALERAFTSGKAAVIDVVIDQDIGYGQMGGRSRQSRQY